MLHWNSFFFGTGNKPIDRGRKDIFKSLTNLSKSISKKDPLSNLNVIFKKLHLKLQLQFNAEQATLAAPGDTLNDYMESHQQQLLSKLDRISHTILRCGNASLVKKEFYSEFFIEFTRYASNSSRLVSM